MDTPITISSCSIKSVQAQPDEIVISDSSTSSLRIPPSWEKKRSSLTRTASNITISNVQKVSNWINSFQSPCSIDNDVDVFSAESSPLSDVSDRRDNNPVYVRCDFNKPVKKDNSVVKENGPFKFCAPLYAYIESTVHKSPNNDKKLLTSMKNESLVNFRDVKREKTVCTSGFQVPLSPESQKKELCSYLQLMNPADKKQILILQNRRSTRVKNLNVIQEKKELEKKLKESSNSDKYLGLKSFKELNIKLDRKKHSWLSVTKRVERKKSEEERHGENFLFPKPHKMLNLIDDFDNIISKKIKLSKIENGIQKRLNNHTEIENVTLKSSHHDAKQEIAECHENEPIFCFPQLPTHLFKSIEHFDRIMDENETKRSEEPVRKTNGEIKRIKKATKRKNKEYLKNRVQLFRQKLRSNRRISTHRLKRQNELRIKRRNEKLKKTRKTIEELPTTTTTDKPTESNNNKTEISRPKSLPNFPHCEIISVNVETDSEVDLKNLIDDMIDFDCLSEEHKKSLIEARILCSKNVHLKSPDGSLLEISPLCGFGKKEIDKFQKIFESQVTAKSTLDADPPPFIFAKSPKDSIKSTEKQCENLDTNEAKTEKTTATPKNQIQLEIPITNGITVTTNDIQTQTDEIITEKPICSFTPLQMSPILYSRTPENHTPVPITPFNRQEEPKSLHRSLNLNKRKSITITNSVQTSHSPQDWVSLSNTQKQRKNQHSIVTDSENGAILKAFYVEFNLIVCQEYMVSFWTQTALGNVLGAQNMFIPKGSIQRLVLNGEAVQKESMEMVVSSESNVAYIELWTKEHKSDIRQRPVADVFVAIYFWRQRQNGLDKKVLQLENIKGFADDVQYSVFKYSPKIIVSWHSAQTDMESKRTYIHCYQLASDYQTVANIKEIEAVSHYVSSLHNIEDCESLIMGCGENKITIWNLEYGYVVSTIELTDIKLPLCTLWVKCDRGFLFTIQQCVDKELRLIAINGHNHTWKKLASYVPPEEYERLKGVCIENGIIVSFFDQGILCWNARTGEPILEETESETEYIPSGKYVIMVTNGQVNVKHAIAHLISPEEI